jgi:thioredoxin-like negative regulator of GroEL
MHAADQGNMPVSKPLLVMIFDQNCKTWCSQVRPIVADLRKSYSEQVEFAEIDVTQTVLKDAKKQAKELGIGNLLADTVSLVPLVLICGSKRSKDYKEFVGPKTKEVYEEWLKKYLPK